MKVYKPGEYHNTFKEMVEDEKGNKTNKYIYVAVFLWDEKWEVPTYNGQKMSKVGYKDAYSLMTYEIKNHYYTSGYKLKDYESYKPADQDIHYIFRVYEQKSSGSGVVKVKDRFGNEYSSTVVW